MPIYQFDRRQATADVNFGIRVDRAGKALAAGTANLFTITGGRVLLVGLLGEVSSALDATATTIQIASLRTDVTTPTATVLCIASAAQGSATVSVMYTLPAAVGSALTTSTGTSAAIMNAVRYVIPVGALQIITTGGANAGLVKWSVWYQQIDDGAYMAAA